MAALKGEIRISEPLVTIGLPTWNNESTILATLESLASQTFTNFEVIVSNDNSTDRTGAIVESYINNLENFRLYNQKQNLGLYENMSFCLSQADSKYFMWLAGDDFISPDFLENNVRYLESNTDFVASSSTPMFMGNGSSEKGHSIVLTGSVESRVRNFFRFANLSHNVFYSIFITEIGKKFQYLGKSFAAADWAFDLFLISHGKICTDNLGYIFFGTHGISRTPNANRRFASRGIEILFPMWTVSVAILRLSQLGIWNRIRLVPQLIRINWTQMKVDILQVKNSLHQ